MQTTVTKTGAIVHVQRRREPIPGTTSHTWAWDVYYADARTFRTQGHHGFTTVGSYPGRRAAELHAQRLIDNDNLAAASGS